VWQKTANLPLLWLNSAQAIAHHCLLFSGAAYEMGHAKKSLQVLTRDFQPV
jgi:hypothetical protein